MNNPAHIERFQQALCSERPSEAISRLAVSLRDEGASQIELFSLFESFHLTTSGDDPRYDVIVDTMDLIFGGPWAKGHDLYPEPLTERQIKEHRSNANDSSQRKK